MTSDVRTTLEIEEERIDDATLALLWLGRHDGFRAWKGFDWATLDRLHRQGLIDNPVGRTKSVLFSEAGLARAEAKFIELFGKR